MFLTSGLWNGYWSPRCEEWFQRRAADIIEAINGVDNKCWQPKSSNAWYEALKYARKQTKDFLRGSELAADDFIIRRAPAALVAP